MYIPIDDAQNYPFSTLKSVVETFAHSTLWTNQLKFEKVPKYLSQRIGKKYYKTLENSVNGNFNKQKKCLN